MLISHPSEFLSRTKWLWFSQLRRCNNLRNWPYPGLIPNYKTDCMTGYSKQPSEFSVLAASGFGVIIKRTDLLRLFPVELHTLPTVVFIKKAFCYLVEPVVRVFDWWTSLQVGWIATCPVMFSRTLVQNVKSRRYRSYTKNVSGDMGWNWFKRLVFKVSTINLTVSVVQKSHKRPAGIGSSRFVHLRPKALWKSVVQSLRKQVFLGNLNHSFISCPVWVTGPAGLFNSIFPQLTMQSLTYAR